MSIKTASNIPIPAQPYFGWHCLPSDLYKPKSSPSSDVDWSPNISDHGNESDTLSVKTYTSEVHDSPQLPPARNPPAAEPQPILTMPSVQWIILPVPYVAYPSPVVPTPAWTPSAPSTTTAHAVPPSELLQFRTKPCKYGLQCQYEYGDRGHVGCDAWHQEKYTRRSRQENIDLFAPMDAPNDPSGRWTKALMLKATMKGRPFTTDRSTTCSIVNPSAFGNQVPSHQTFPSVQQSSAPFASFQN